MIEINREELACSAGFFNGEGSTWINKQKKGAPSVRVGISQVEREQLDRFDKATGELGKVYGPIKSKQPRRKPHYVYKTSGHKAQAVIALLWNWLSTQKREQAKIAILAWKRDKRIIGRPRSCQSNKPSNSVVE